MSDDTMPDDACRTDANARLIAADLLDACQELRDALAAAMRVIAGQDDSYGTLSRAFINETARIGIPNGVGVRADAAIAKARSV